MSKKPNSINTALVRVDYNVPIQNGKILDLKRIEASLPTLNYLIEQNTPIVLMSHLGRPKNINPAYSLKILIKPIERLLNKKVIFIENPQQINIPIGSIGLLENLRFYSGEKQNDRSFCEQLAKLGDFYINDAFGASHREHASISGIKEFFPNKNYKGLLLESELHQLNILKKNPKSPYTIIVGGSKIGSKIHMLEAFLDIADNILVGGGMAFPFIKYSGGDIGQSICQDSELDIVKSFLNKAKLSKTKIIFPLDFLVTKDLASKEHQKIVDSYKIPMELMGVDIGPKTISLFNEYIINSQSIMWNGPMGVSEINDFSHGTRSLAESIKIATNSGAYSLIGGGDTASDISRFGFEKSFSFISTGGGAMLEFFKNPNLIGFEKLKNLK
tara:strand:+ start:169 stop:1329 length:1161 start_codon:yes stop_codon:yes gene_type:complete